MAMRVGSPPDDGPTSGTNHSTGRSRVGGGAKSVDLAQYLAVLLKAVMLKAIVDDLVGTPAAFAALKVAAVAARMG
jgi:hypothetical protein